MAPASAASKKPRVDAAQHDHDQDHDRRDLHQNFERRQQLVVLHRGGEGALADEVRREPGHRRDRDDIGTRQQQARDDAGQEHIADRLLGDEGVDDHHHARRDDHAEHRGAGHHADGKALRIIEADHLRHGYAREHRGRRDRGAGDGGKGGVGGHRGDAETAAQPAEQLIGDLIDVGAETGLADDHPHHHECGNAGVVVMADGGGHRQRHHAHGDGGVALDDPHAEEGDEAERDGDVAAAVDHQDDQDERQDADNDGFHGRCRQTGSGADARQWCTARMMKHSMVAVLPSTTMPRIGHSGMVKMPCSPM